MYSNENIEYLLDLGNHFLSRAKNAIKKDDVLDDDDKNQMIDVVKSNDIKNFYKMDTIVRDHLIIALSSEFNFLCADELSEIADMLRNYYDMLADDFVILHVRDDLTLYLPIEYIVSFVIETISCENE